MKRLLVPTDFSVPAENAVKYAMAMAKAIDADLTLVNAYMVPIPVSETGMWPVIDVEDIPAHIGGELDILVKKLTDVSCKKDEPYLCPQIDYRCEEGGVLQVINRIYKELNADLLIMGLSGAGGLVNFILGSNSMAMIEKGKRPVLLIPYGAGFKSVKKIVYAGQLNQDDIAPLKFVCNIASWFNAEVSILHVVDMRKDLNTEIQCAGEDFVDQFRILSGYNRLRYESVWNRDVDQGLEWIAEQEDIDIVCMLHHKHNIIEKIFKGSRTKAFARCSSTPLLVFPPEFATEKH